jgi:hypothetical protein
MTVLRIVRFTTDPEAADDMLVRRAALIGATRRCFDGLLGTRLARVDERTWIDHWHWESADQMQRAVDNVATIPGAREAFAVIGNPIPEVAEVVGERDGWAR